MSKTINYYNENADRFIEGTVSVDFEHIQTIFLGSLNDGAHILDFGCGSGRDTKYFLNKGYTVDAIDGSVELCKAASSYTGIDVKHMMFDELNEVEKYDGIWACASILHIKKTEQLDVFHKINRALKPNGIVYVSFKYGDFEGERNGRYFTNMTEESIHELLKNIPDLTIEKLWTTDDARVGRGDEQWINMIARKQASI